MSREIDVIDHLHAIMHLFKDRMRQALHVNGEGLGHMEARALRFFFQHPGSTQQDLAAHSGRDKAQITRIVQNLMERGLLVREADPKDRRRLQLQLTQKGLDLQAAMHERRNRLAADMLHDLDVGERRQLIYLLERMRTNAAYAEAAHKQAVTE